MDFGRVLTAMVTPFDAEGELNAEVAAALAVHLIENGNDGIVVAGTTGESPTLTHSEKLTLFRTVREAVGSRAVVIAGTGNYCTRESIELTRAAEAIGVDGIMCVVPYYNNPPQEGLYAHFRAIAESTHLPMMLYNVPSRSPRNMEAETTLRLAEIPNIVAIKEASGKTEQATHIIRRAPAGFRVYSGDDSLTLPLLSVGAHGVVSVAGHIVGTRIREMIDHHLAGRASEAARLHGQLLPFFDACFCSTNPIPIKAAVKMIGIPVGGVRLPMVDADERVLTILTEAFASQKIPPYA